MGPTRRHGRPTALPSAILAVGLLLVGVLPASAQVPETRGIDRVCPAPVTTDDTDPDAEAFPDLGDIHGEAISCAAAYGIVSGFEDGTFRPGEPITRGQMATFVASWLTAATGRALPEPDEVAFSDVEGSVHASAIGAVAEAGIVGGREDGTFAPNETLTRGQFTRAVVGAISYADIFAVGGPLPPEGGEVTFTDVEGTTFEATILALAGVGLAGGTGDGAFAPQAPVTRGQLATFLMRAADYLDRHQRWRPTALSGALLVADLRLPDDRGPRGTATLSINAFNGTLAFSLDLSEAPGPYGEDGAAIHLGDPSDGGPLAIQLVGPEGLEEGTGGVVTGVVIESDSAVRFADLLHAPGDAHVRVATDAGTLRGTLREPTG